MLEYSVMEGQHEYGDGKNMEAGLEIEETNFSRLDRFAASPFANDPERKQAQAMVSECEG